MFFKEERCRTVGYMQATTEPKTDSTIVCTVSRTYSSLPGFQYNEFSFTTGSSSSCVLDDCKNDCSHSERHILELKASSSHPDSVAHTVLTSPHRRLVCSGTSLQNCAIRASREWESERAEPPDEAKSWSVNFCVVFANQARGLADIACNSECQNSINLFMKLPKTRSSWKQPVSSECPRRCRERANPQDF